MARRGVTPDLARAIMRTNTTAIGAVMVHRGEADSLICGTFGQYLWHLNYVTPGAGAPTGCSPVRRAEPDDPARTGRSSSPTRRSIPSPTPEQIAETVIGAARHVRRFGLAPKVALVRSSQFGNLDSDSGRRMRAALAILDAPRASISTTRARCTSTPRSTPSCAQRHLPGRRMEGPANVLIFAYDRRGLGRAQHPEDAGAAGSRSGRS